MTFISAGILMKMTKMPNDEQCNPCNGDRLAQQANPKRKSPQLHAAPSHCTHGNCARGSAQETSQRKSYVTEKQPDDYSGRENSRKHALTVPEGMH